MSSDVIAIRVRDLGKAYQIYDRPQDRLKQSMMPRLRGLLGKSTPNYYREFWALRDVSFEVRKGETVGIIGRNGSGKSTLLQVICGTLTPTTGTVETTGRVAALLELGAGFNPEFTGRENVYLNGSVLGLTQEEIDQRFDAIAAFADIGEFIEQPVKSYSSGMVVRLGFAVAINVDPEILIVDEALSVGDEIFQRKCFSRIEAIKSKGATILFVSHSGATVVGLCDRAILLDGGERLATGLPKQIVGRYQKLLYAPAERRSAIRQEILERDRLMSGASADTTGETHPPAQQPQVGAADELQESFDPGMRPAATIAYESQDVMIEEPAIYTVAGERVNKLIRGRGYEYRYKATFTAAANSVRFGMMIKTTNGIELGGATSAASMCEAVPLVSAGSIYEAVFHFTCSLNPGVYFLNAGVTGLLDGTQADTYTALHRLLDAAMFRVLPESGSLSTGFVDFNCVPEILALSNAQA
jgi:lipopolysaccharide transport system ATP-binding protein